MVVLGDGPELDPAAIDRVIAAWRASGQRRSSRPPTAASGSIRSWSHREVWPQIPDEGAKNLDAVLVACDDLCPPGDVDFADEVPERLKPWSSPDP